MVALAIVATSAVCFVAYVRLRPIRPLIQSNADELPPIDQDQPYTFEKITVTVARADEQPVSQTVDFGVFWPPLDPTNPSRTKTRPLLNGRVNVCVRDIPDVGLVATIRIDLTRPSGEASREFWNSRLAYVEYDWMSEVRVWDAGRRWLWPNLPYLLRLHGEERIERYGGIDPGKGVDNDFAAVLIRKYDAERQRESPETKTKPLVSAEWYPVGSATVDGKAIVHTARSDEFTIHLQKEGGRAGIWLIYADFLGAKPPSSWPEAREFAGGILAYFEIRWAAGPAAGGEISFQQFVPPQGTGFDWGPWVSLTRKSADPRGTAKLSDQ